MALPSTLILPTTVFTLRGHIGSEFLGLLASGFLTPRGCNKNSCNLLSQRIKEKKVQSYIKSKMEPE